MSVITPEFRVSFPSVFKPKLNELNGKQEFSLVALFPKTADLTSLKKEVNDAIAKKWGPDKKRWPSPLKSPFRDQSERKKVDDLGNEALPAGYVNGAIFITLKSSNKPGVVDQQVQPIIDEADFYAGCYARAKIQAYAYEVKGNKGVAFGLVNIQKTRDGDPLTGRSRPEDDFKPIEVEGISSLDDLTL